MVVGGGLVGDVGGFAAASWLRGVDVVQIPTTLLAMVDASVGGKTAVNVPLPDSVGGGLGKNMAGAFWPPRLVLADPETLQTLPSRHISCGLAEAVKHGLLADPDLLDLIERMGPALVKGSLDGAETIISRAVSIKADIVARDELESGQRALLNLGHTFAHAIEGRPALGLHHGEAVAIGLMAAGALGVQLETMASDALDRLRSLLASLSLPVILPGPCPADQLLERMRFDKKMDQGTMRLIVPQAPCGACIRTDVSDAQVLEAWRSVGAS